MKETGYTNSETSHKCAKQEANIPSFFKFQRSAEEPLQEVHLEMQSMVFVLLIFTEQRSAANISHSLMLPSEMTYWEYELHLNASEAEHSAHTV